MIGLYPKFFVSRTDGRDAPGGDKHGAEYFVLDLTHDEAARLALKTYANAIEDTEPELANDLRKLYL